MGLLGRVAFAALAVAGCYDPELPDCVVRCTHDKQCATDHVCGSDGYCARPEVAGTCERDGLTSEQVDEPVSEPAP